MTQAHAPEKLQVPFPDKGLVREDEFWPDSKLKAVRWFDLTQLKLHNPEGPAEAGYYKDGGLHFQAYYKKGNMHRTDGPASEFFYTSGQKRHEGYWQNDKRHRTDGPAHIDWDESGNVVRQDFYKKGVQFFPTAHEIMAMAEKAARKEELAAARAHAVNVKDKPTFTSGEEIKPKARKAFVAAQPIAQAEKASGKAQNTSR